MHQLTVCFSHRKIESTTTIPTPPIQNAQADTFSSNSPCTCIDCFPNLNQIDRKPKVRECKIRPLFPPLVAKTEYKQEEFRTLSFATTSQGNRPILMSSVEVKAGPSNQK